MHFRPETFGQNFEDKRLLRIVQFRSLTVPPSAITTETLAGTIANLPTGKVKPLSVLGNIHIGWKNFWHNKQLVGVRTLQIATFTETLVTSANVEALCLSLAEIFIGYRKEQAACLDVLGSACRRM